jgi:hypothetical protein
VECRLIIESTDRWKWVEDCYSQQSQRISGEGPVMMNAVKCMQWDSACSMHKVHRDYKNAEQRRDLVAVVVSDACV